MKWLRLSMICLVIATLTGKVCADKVPLGRPQRGLQATITSSQQTYQISKEIVLIVAVTNVSDKPLQIDPWPGNWFVQVFDEHWNFMPHVRAVDILRPMPRPITLQPGEHWDTTINGLSLTSALPGSTSDWEYEPLKSGIYWVGAEYTVPPDPDHPEMWSGGLNCVLIKIEIVSIQK